MKEASGKRMARPDPANESVVPQVASEKLRKLSKHGVDADEAMKAFAGQEGEVALLDEGD